MATIAEEFGAVGVAEPSTAPANIGGLYRVKEVAVHATGLRLPSHLGMLHDGRVLVSEFGGGTVRDVTEPGDYTEQSRGRHAWSLKHPGGILPAVDGRILVADSGTGQVHDITDEGAVGSKTLVFEGVSNPYGLVEKDGHFYTSFSNNEMVGIAEVTPGESFSEDAVFVWGFPVVITAEPFRVLMGCGGSWPQILMSGKILLAHSALGAIFDVTPGGGFEDLRERRWAWGLSLPLGMTVDPLDSDLYVTERITGAIRRIGPEGGYARFAQPVLAGFQDPSCIRFNREGTAAYVCDRALDTVYRVDLEHVR